MGKQRKALGKGLGALIPGADLDAAADSAESADASQDHARRVYDLAVTDIEPNPHQPRTAFDPDRVDELAQSIREKGIIQPLSVRRFGDGYQLIAGERRLRAAQLADLETVPALVLDVTTDQEMMEVSLIENIQREDLNPIEEARAYRALMEECELTQEEVAEKVGKDRSTVANTLRLLNLSPEVREALQSDQISMGHARALLGLDDDRLQAALCKEIVVRGLSVRKVEELVRGCRDGKPQKPEAQPRDRDPQVVAVEEDLQRHFGTAVTISRKGTIGKIEIEFYSDDDLERLLELLRPEPF
ncbi:MAG: ParB/RepB/Spo0J family partition protein [Candidatus Latescibacteria bacterium]|jgi:ParB family chromosome partitioning protein|nr:ParB/RepB/Spo0J family partition protein [Candidatus Latescibacterota bacterium]